MTPGAGTVPEDSSSGAQTTHARTVSASSDGSPGDEHKHSAASASHSAAETAPARQEMASVPPLAPPQLSEGDAELASATEVEQDSFKPGFNRS